ncbi:MAG: hypothetical protein K2P06_10320 [Muribaculaceae bacterium]|nr:hypothetical protein [Muribaculaceae bacterium]
MSGFLFASADTPGTTNGTIGNGGELTPKPKIPGRPKAPSAQVVEAAYEDGYLYLNFKYSEGPAVLYVYDADQTTLRSQHVFNTDGEAAVYIGTVTDAYLLVETSSGHEYEGWIY